MREKREEKEEKFLKKWAKLCLIVAIILLLTVFTYFHPFPLLLPRESFPSMQEGELRIHFLSVGEGDCAVVQFPDNDVCIIDGGDGSFLANRAIISYLNGLEVGEITLILTHADIDHYGGFYQILQLFPVHTVYLPIVESEFSSYRKLLSFIEEKGCQTSVLTRYSQIIDESGAYFTCLSPYSTDILEKNHSSCVLYFSYQGVRAVFGGDCTAERERVLANEYAIDEEIFNYGNYFVDLRDIDVFKVAHHGSEGSSADEWIALLNPKASVISCGKGNLYAHPSEETLRKLSSSLVYRTDELGHIAYRIYGGKGEFFRP